ncbi:membrane protein [Beggiatoa sp. PS]|nr:membrane protein [Beggiatoa sp. PS]
MKLIDNFIKSRLLRYKLAFFLTVVILMAWIAVFIFLTHSPDWTLVFSQLPLSLWAIFTVGVFFIGLSQWTFAWQIPDKSNPSYLSKWLIHLLAMGLPLLLFWLLYHQVLNAWWSFDDPHTLHYVDSIGPWAGFFEADKKIWSFLCTTTTLICCGRLAIIWLKSQRILLASFIVG